MKYPRLAHCRRCATLLSLLALLLVSLAACAGATNAIHKALGGKAEPLPHFDHIVVVVEENHSYEQIFGGSGDMPAFAALAQQGAVFTDSHGITHPSQPNYLALFAGSTFGLTSDACPQNLSGDTLASALSAHNLTFRGYSESLPQPGYTGCFSDGYARKHNPWVDFASVPAADNQPFSAFPTDYSQLPAVAFVVPNQRDDTHSGTIAAADDWLRQNIAPYAQWAASHNSLLIVTWDEDDDTDANHIPTIFVGAHIHPGQYAETINHYDVLRTIEALEGVSFTGQAASGATISDVWQP